MPDIMMCAAKACSLSEQCYRHKSSGTEPDQYRQCWWAREDTDPTGDDCPNFWKRTPLTSRTHDGSIP